MDHAGQAAAGAAGHAGGILLGLFIVYLAAQIGAEVAGRLRLPSVVGEIAAGCLIGPSLLGWVTINEPLTVLAEIGAVLLLFSVGLETRLADLRKVGKSATLVAILGVILPFILGALWAKLSGFETPKALFVAAAFVATSAGITARVLADLGALGRTEARVILGAAVIDDILAMLLLGVVTALQAGGGTGGANAAGGNAAGGVDWLRLGLVLVQAVGFIVVIALVGTRFVRKHSGVLDAPISPLSPLTLSLGLCLGLAAAASSLGLAAIIGAFLAGMVLAESPQRRALERQIQPILALMVPFFFVVTGAQVNLRDLGSVGVLVTLAVVTLLAVIGKLAGCGLGALSLGKNSALIVGWGMVPRGEVGIIIATLGKSAGVFSGPTYTIIIAMSLLTSVIAPPILKSLLARTPDNAAPPEDTPDNAPPTITDEDHLLRVDECGFDRTVPQKESEKV